MKTVAFQRGTAGGGPYLVLIHGAAAPQMTEWSAYVRAVETALLVAVGTLHIFVATDGGAPNAAQRKLLADAFEKSASPALTHVFSTSAFVRGVVTAFSWMTRSHAIAHAPAEFVSVCTACGLAPAAVLRDLIELQRAFGDVQVVRQVELSMTARVS